MAQYNITYHTAMAMVTHRSAHQTDKYILSSFARYGVSGIWSKFTVLWWGLDISMG